MAIKTVVFYIKAKNNTGQVQRIIMDMVRQVPGTRSPRWQKKIPLATDYFNVLFKYLIIFINFYWKQFRKHLIFILTVC